MPGSDWDWGIFGFIALVPWALATQLIEKRKWLLDAFFALCFFSFTVWWIGYVSWVGAIFVILIETVLWLPTGWLFRRLRQRMSATFALPLAWCAVEFLRIRYPVDGLPFSVLGFSFYEKTIFIQIADVFGVIGISFLLCLINGLLVDGLYANWFMGSQSTAKQRKIRIGVVLGSMLIAMCYGILRKNNVEDELSPGPTVLAIQPNIPAESKGEPMSGEKILRRHLELSRESLKGQTVDLLLWAEGMFPWALGDSIPGAVYREDWKLTSEQAQENESALRKYLFDSLELKDKTAVLLGALYFAKQTDGSFATHNSAVLFSSQGERAGVYHKIHLVPGGEFVPSLGPISWLAEQLAGLEGFRGQMGEMVPGKEPKVLSFQTPRGSWKVGVSICYDNAYSDLYLEEVRQGADFHVVLSNEGWYGHSSEFEQLLAASVFRAIETRRSFLRVTNSGISALISPTGQVLAEVEKQGERKQVEGALRTPVEITQTACLYQVWGDWPLWILILFTFSFALFTKRKETFENR